jgi:hypothetical protein
MVEKAKVNFIASEFKQKFALVRSKKQPAVNFLLAGFLFSASRKPRLMAFCRDSLAFYSF